MKPNRYIKAMEIGLSHEEEGISYFDLVYELHGTDQKQFSKEAELTFFKWFHENFDCIEENWDIRANDYKGQFWWYLVNNEKGGDYHSSGIDRRLHNILLEPFFLRGLAAKQYLDYREYKAARKNALWATIFAIISILIAAVSFLLSFQATKEAPRPPYDVKIIEDNTRTQQLEKENRELIDKLNKAEVTLRAFENDSLKVKI